MKTRTFTIEIVVNGIPRSIDAEFREQPDGSWTNVAPIDIPPTTHERPRP